MTAPPFVLPDRLELPEGLVGLPTLRAFDVHPPDTGGLIELISVDDPQFGFAAVAADAVRDGYTSTLVENSVVGPDAIVLVLLAVHGDPPVVTANLAGPLVVAPDGRARQHVLEGPEFSLRAPVAAAG